MAAATIRKRLAVIVQGGVSIGVPSRLPPVPWPRESESRSVNNTRLYVGNLAFHTTEDSLLAAFSRFGEVSDVKLVIDRETGRSRGFAFITMSTAEAASRAISEMDGQSLDGRSLRVNEAEARPPRSGGGGAGGPRGGGGYGGGGSRGGFGGGGRNSDRGGRGGDRGRRW